MSPTGRFPVASAGALRHNEGMSYTLTLVTGEDASETERRAAEQRFRRALDATLGDANLVLPTYSVYLRIVSTYGESPDVTALSDAEREVVEQWQAAESAALTAALGPHRYLDDARFEIGV
jgi:hypothetical protein